MNVAPKMTFRTMTLCLMLLFFCTLSHVKAATAPHTIIDNRAEVTYFNTESGEVETVLSNTSRFVVAAVHRFELEGPADAIAHAGKFFGLPFRINNIGNIADRYSLSLSDFVNDAGELADLAIYIDKNGNGQADPGEPIVDGPLTVEADSLIELVVAGNIPSTALEDEQYQIELTATGTDLQLDTLGAENSNGPQTQLSTITIVDGAFIAISKNSNRECSAGVAPGSDIDYRIDFTNSGNQEPVARSFLIDGVQRDGVLIVDTIPIGLQLLPLQQIVSAPFQSIPVVPDRSNDGWIPYSDWDGEDIANSIALFVPATNIAPGQTGNFAFSLRVPNRTLLGTVIENVASIDIDGDGQSDFASDSVCNRIFTSEPQIGAAFEASLQFVAPAFELRSSGAAPDFFNNEDFVESEGFQLDTGGFGYDVVRDGLYLELNASGLPPGTVVGEDSQGGKIIVVALESLGSGDTLQVIMLETAPGSETFRSIRPVALNDNGTRGNGAFCPGGDSPPVSPFPDFTADAPECVLASLPGDTLRVLFGDDGNGVAVLSDTVVISPTAFVFDAFTFEPIAGAEISILQDASLGLLASPGLFNDTANASVALNPFNGEPLVFVTDENGSYNIPPLAPGNGYFINVVPPEAWTFPSDINSDDLIAFNVNSTAYGPNGIGGESGVFSVAEGQTTPLSDIPLDPVDRFNRITVDKRALQVEAEPGDVVAYSVNISNRTDEQQFNVHVEDVPPFGFKYVPGTTRLNDELIDDPEISDDNVLDFSLGLFEANIESELTYVLEATAGSVDSDGVNTAFATARSSTGVPLRSPDSRARVFIRRTGVLSENAALFGKVYIDSDCNNLHNDAEWPIGGVRLYLDDGTFAITDENGQYSIFGLEPGTRVIRADPLTVPEGLTFKPLDNANAADGDSRFVILEPGDFHRADFGVSCPTANIEEVFAEIRERNSKVDSSFLLQQAEDFDPLEDDTADRRDAIPDADAAEIDGDLSNGILNGPDSGRTRTEKRIDDNDTESKPKKEAPSEKKEKVKLDPKIAVRTITKEQAKLGTWLWPENDTSTDGRFVAVVRAGIEPTLFVNGQAVDTAQIGERIENVKEGAQIVAWYGVQLEPGLNRVEVRGKDPFGNNRVLAKGEFKRPASGSRMVLRARTDTLAADGGRSVLPIEINILDDNDYPAQGVYFVTLQSDEDTGGQWLEEDLQESEPGHQVRIDDGRGTVNLKSSDFTGTIVISARANELGANLRVFQVAARRPLFGIGQVEIGVIENDLSSGGPPPTDQADDIEDGTKLDGRVSLFLKGTVRNDAHLTLSYDSDKDSDTELLRDINPGEQYPIQGDASIRGFEAQSRSKLSAKLEKGRSSVMWGDYVTDLDSDVDDLARQRRVLTGFNSRYDNGRTRLQLFAARAEESRRSEEIPGNGTALLFRLSNAPIVANSEVVEIITFDRENPGLIIASRRLTRFGDYNIDSISGEISFAEVIPTFDADLNPIFVRVTYDEENGGEEQTVIGVRARHEINDSVAVGAAITDDASPVEGGTLAGAYVAWEPDERTRVTAGVATVNHNDGTESGNAQRISAERRWGGERERATSLTAANADPGYVTADSSVAAGRRELRVNHNEKLSPTMRGSAEVTYSESVETDELRSTIGIEVDKSFSDWTVRGGVRHIRQRTSSESDNFTTITAGAERRFKIGDRNASVDLGYEQDLTLLDRNLVSFGSRLQLHDHVQLTARYERQNGIFDFGSIGDNATQNFTFGAESDIIDNTRLYSEYRLVGGISGRRFATANGVRGNYVVTPGFTVTPSVELVNTISGEDNGDGIAFSLGVNDLRNPNVRATAQAEYRNGNTSDFLGFRGSYAARLNLDWTALAREDIRRQNIDGGEVELRHALTFGLARRPRLNNRHHMLFQFQWKVDREEGEAGDRDAVIFSTHQNYQFNSVLNFSGRLGAKRQKSFLFERDLVTSAYLADGRATWDINRRWSLSGRAGLLKTGDGASYRHAFGFGVTHVFARNLQLHFGFNITGFRDEDLDPIGYDAKGIRFGLRYKFDETPFSWLSDSQ